MKYIAPQPDLPSFTCPHCGSIALHSWWKRTWDGNENWSDNKANKIRASKCVHCFQSTLWIDSKMYYPDTGNAPFPNPEMPVDVNKLYLEAASIYSKSPRGAAALLRLAIQVLCKELGQPGKNINTDIAALVKKGLPEIVQQSLDIVRVTGNDAVHPGQIDTDDPKVVTQLFNLINIIVEYMIALPQKVSGLYSELPTEKTSAIKSRDGK